MVACESVGILIIARLETEHIRLEIDGITLWHHLLIKPVLVALLQASRPGAELCVNGSSANGVLASLSGGDCRAQQ